MSDTNKPNIQIPVDLTNPGQFFACCGLLELADRLWPGAEGWFDSPSSFQISGHQKLTLDSLLESIKQCEFTPLLPNSELAELRELEMRKKALKAKRRSMPPDAERRRKFLNSKRIVSGFRLGSPFNLHVDWWLADDCDGSHLATWAGQQAISEIAADMQWSLPLAPAAALLETETAIRRATGGNPRAPLSFDAGRMGTAQDVGYSSDNVGQVIACAIWTEFMALVGIQRCALKPDNYGVFTFNAWNRPLPIVAASAVAKGLVSAAIGLQGRFGLAGRDSEGRYKVFRHATLTEWIPA